MTNPDAIKSLLSEILDPDVGVNIVDLGLVESVRVDGQTIHVGLIMTTPACPQTGHLKSEAARILTKAGFTPEVSILETPLWSPDRLSPLARKSLGWGG